MGKKICQRPIISVSFLSICFLVGLVFASYYEMSEVDTFSPNLCYENQDLATSTFTEKTKINLSIPYFEHPLLSMCNSFLQGLPCFINLPRQPNCPIRC